AAVERALAYVLSARDRLLDDPRDAVATYRTWARTYALRFLVRCARQGVGDPGALRPVIDALVQSLAARQGPSGGWAYLALAANPGDGLASSFLSAAVLLALCEARDL